MPEPLSMTAAAATEAAKKVAVEVAKKAAQTLNSEFADASDSEALKARAAKMNKAIETIRTSPAPDVVDGFHDASSNPHIATDSNSNEYIEEIKRKAGNEIAEKTAEATDNTVIQEQVNLKTSVNQPENMEREETLSHDQYEADDSNINSEEASEGWAIAGKVAIKVGKYVVEEGVREIAAESDNETLQKHVGYLNQAIEKITPKKQSNENISNIENEFIEKNIWSIDRGQAIFFPKMPDIMIRGIIWQNDGRKTPWTIDMPDGTQIVIPTKEVSVLNPETGEMETHTFPDFSEVAVPPGVIFEIPEDKYGMSYATHFRECNKQLQQWCEQNPEEASKIFNQEQLDQIANGEVPKGYTWHHTEIPGQMQLVPTKIHQACRHTGGQAIWGTKGTQSTTTTNQE